MADEICQGHCNIRSLALIDNSSSSKGTEAVKAIASAIRLDRNLKYLYLETENVFTDEAGVALAAALTANTTLRNIFLSELPWGTQVYEAFSAMLRVNTSVVLKLLPQSESASFGDERLVDSRNQMRIEQELNCVGRGRLLSSSQNTREDWVDALDELDSQTSNVIDFPDLNINCLYSLLRLNPAICLLKLDGTPNPGDYKSR